MDCSFSDPQDFQGHTPTTTLDSFQFSKAHCDFITPVPVYSTASGQLSLIPGTEILATPPASLVNAFGEFAISNYVFQVILVFGFFFLLGYSFLILKR